MSEPASRKRPRSPDAAVVAGSEARPSSAGRVAAAVAVSAATEHPAGSLPGKAATAPPSAGAATSVASGQAGAGLQAAVAVGRQADQDTGDSVPAQQADPPTGTAARATQPAATARCESASLARQADEDDVDETADGATRPSVEIASLPIPSGGPGAAQRVALSAPRELGRFSFTADLGVEYDARALRRYRPPVLPARLDVGFELAATKLSKSRRLSLLEPVLRVLRHAQVRTPQLKPDFVSWRGDLTFLLTTLYARRDAWEIDVQRETGTVYLSPRVPASRQADERNASERQRRMAYWGYKFEQVCTDKDARDDTVVDGNEAFCIVVQSRLGAHSLVYGAEVDCVDADGAAWVELKTSRVIQDARAGSNFARHKLLKFWAQSFLAGVPIVRCGFRDDNGIVRVLQDLRTLDIPGQVKRSAAAERREAPWDAQACLVFADTVLTWLRDVTRDGSRYQLRYEPAVRRDTLVLYHADGRETCSWPIIVPPWFLAKDK